MARMMAWRIDIDISSRFQVQGLNLKLGTIS